VNDVRGYAEATSGAYSPPVMQWGLARFSTDELLQTSLNATSTTVNGNQMTSFIALSSFSGSAHYCFLSPKIRVSHWAVPY
jgi:hypothetical protein